MSAAANAGVTSSSHPGSRTLSRSAALRSTAAPHFRLHRAIHASGPDQSQPRARFRPQHALPRGQEQKEVLFFREPAREQHLGSAVKGRRSDERYRVGQDDHATVAG